MKTNTKPKNRKPIVTHEGAKAAKLAPLQELRRTVMACFLWEDSFYENGESVAARIAALVPKVPAADVALLAVEAREAMKLRHVPLLLVREMVRHEPHRLVVAKTLEQVIQRPDELTEFLSIYWKDNPDQPLAAQVKKGLAAAFVKFNEYSLAKYNSAHAEVRLRDAMFLVHPTPQSKNQAALWKKLANDALAAPDTWEVALSAGSDKKKTWERLLKEGKLGALALLRNLRNMDSARVLPSLIEQSLRAMSVERVLPFRFLAAAEHAPRWEPELEAAMFKCLKGRTKLKGRTILLVDVSGSMVGTPVSAKSDLDGLDAAAALAILLREVCQNVQVLAFNEEVHQIPARRGFALRDALRAVAGGGTVLGAAVDAANAIPHDRLIVLTDEQSAQPVGKPSAKGYMVNVANYQRGVGYGPWVRVEGWSEAVVDYITAFEA